MFQAKGPFVLIHILIIEKLYQITPKWPQIQVSTVRPLSFKKTPRSLLLAPSTFFSCSAERG